MMIKKHPEAETLKHIANDLTDGKISKQVIVPGDVHIVHSVHFQSQSPQKKTNKGNHSPCPLFLLL